MKLVVAVAEMKLSNRAGDILVTHALGSCLGIAIHDPVAKVGGLLHIMLPLSTIDPDKARDRPFMFVDTGVPQFFREAYALGALKKRLAVKVAGGANVQGNGRDRFAIGKRNYIVLKRILWKNGVFISAEVGGGKDPRTMHLEVGSGRVWISGAGEAMEL